MMFEAIVTSKAFRTALPVVTKQAASELGTLRGRVEFGAFVIWDLLREATPTQILDQIHEIGVIRGKLYGDIKIVERGWG
jgi:hypothetical protein